MVAVYTTACFYYELNGSILHMLSVTKTCFFLATVMSGHLHVDGIPEWGPWEGARLHWWPEDHVEPDLPTIGDWKVGTLEELQAAIKEPMRVVTALAAGLETYTWNIDPLYDSAMHGTDTEASAEMNVLYYDPKCASRTAS